MCKQDETSPEGVSSVLGKVLASGVPEYDYKGKLRSLLDILANKGKKDDAIKYAVILRDLPGIYDLFKQLDRKD